MGKAISKAGWLLFIAAAVGAFVRTGSDDPLTATLKASGVYQPAMLGLAIVFGLILIWLIREMRVGVRLQRKLNELKARKDR